MTDILMFGLLSVISLLALAWLLVCKVLPVSKIIRDIEQSLNISDERTARVGMPERLRRIGNNIRVWEGHKNRLEILQKQANLAAFQNQINPHFLYNTLDTIRGQALEDGSEVASDMIEVLSQMMRYAISNKETMVTLGVEVKSIDNYIKIQQYRFGNRFEYVKSLEEIDNRLIDIKIPKMTLQPVVENALLHGIESVISGGEIRLSGFNTESLLVLQISDNGVGIDESRLAAIRSSLSGIEPDPGSVPGSRLGIALTNVNTRLKLTFGNSGGLAVYSTLNIGTLVEITLPLNGGGEF